MCKRSALLRYGLSYMRAQNEEHYAAYVRGCMPSRRIRRLDAPLTPVHMHRMLSLFLHSQAFLSETTLYQLPFHAQLFAIPSLGLAREPEGGWNAPLQDRQAVPAPPLFWQLLAARHGWHMHGYGIVVYNSCGKTVASSSGFKKPGNETRQTAYARAHIKAMGTDT